MKYAHLDGEKLLGWYAQDIHDVIPTPNVEVSDEVWMAALTINANAYVGGQFIVKDFSTQEQRNQDRILILKRQLAETDYKDLPSYDKRNTPEWDQLMDDRQSWRAEIRQLEN